MVPTVKESKTQHSGASLNVSSPSAGPGISASAAIFTWSYFGLALFIFALSLTVQLVHHLLTDHSLVMFAFDGKHYLATAQAMTGALMQLFHGDGAAFFSTIKGSVYSGNLVWDGPVIPGIPAVIFALIGRKPVESDWTYFAVFFSVLASYSAVLVSLATRALTSNNRLALTSGLLFALYPTTLLATGVYRSEILAVSMMMTLILALSRAPSSVFAALVAGIVGGVFAMVKPVMIPAIGLLCLFSGMHGKHKVKTIVLLALAGILTIAPWSVYTAIDCGKLSITAERGPSYNAGVGTDLAANGWCTMPETEHVALAKQNKSPLAVFAAQWKAHPYELSKLTVRRITRLWANPWNDFREAVFGLPVQAQVVWHLIFVCLGFMGLALYAAFPPAAGASEQGEDSDDRVYNRRLLGNLCAIALLSHLSFIMFQTMGRYAYTSMALLAVFAAFGLGRLSDLVSARRRAPQKSIAASARVLGGTAVAALGIALALLIVNCDSFTHQGEAREVAHTLAPGASAGRRLDMGQQASGRGVLVLIDIEQDARDRGTAGSVGVRLNGHQLSGPLLPLNCFNGRRYFLFDTMAEHAAFMRTDVQQFRQWRAVFVEPEANLLKQGEGGVSEIEIVNNGRYPLTVYGDTQRREGKIVPLPSPDYFASDRMLVSLTSDESRINSLIPEAVVSQKSYIKDGGIENLDDNLRLQLALFDATDKTTASTATTPTVATAGGAEAAQTIALVPGQFHWYARSRDGLHLNKAVLKGVGPVSATVKLNSLPADCTQVQVTFTGLARRNSGPGRLGVSAELSAASGARQQLDQFADYVAVPGGQWSTFALTDVVPVSRLGGATKVSNLTLALLPCPRLESCYGGGRQCSDIEVKDLRLQIKALHQTDIVNATLSVY